MSNYVSCQGCSTPVMIEPDEDGPIALCGQCTKEPLASTFESAAQAARRLGFGKPQFNTQRSPANQGRTAVYEWYDADDRLLYIGISGDVVRRSGEHEQVKHWWADVARSKVTHYPTRALAMEIERALIQHLKPIYNIVHNERRVQRAVLSGSRHLQDDDQWENRHEQVMECMNILKECPPDLFKSPVRTSAYLRAEGHVISRVIIRQALKRLRGEATPGGDWLFGEELPGELPE